MRSHPAWVLPTGKKWAEVLLLARIYSDVHFIAGKAELNNSWVQNTEQSLFISECAIPPKAVYFCNPIKYSFFLILPIPSRAKSPLWEVGALLKASLFQPRVKTPQKGKLSHYPMDKETLMWAILICEELALFYGCRVLHLIKTTRISLLQSTEYIVFIQTLSICIYICIILIIGICTRRMHVLFIMWLHK